MMSLLKSLMLAIGCIASKDHPLLLFDIASDATVGDLVLQLMNYSAGTGRNFSLGDYFTPDEIDIYDGEKRVKHAEVLADTLPRRSVQELNDSAW